MTLVVGDLTCDLWTVAQHAPIQATTNNKHERTNGRTDKRTTHQHNHRTSWHTYIHTSRGPELIPLAYIHHPTNNCIIVGGLFQGARGNWRSRIASTNWLLCCSSSCYCQPIITTDQTTDQHTSKQIYNEESGSGCLRGARPGMVRSAGCDAMSTSLILPRLCGNSSQEGW